MKIVLGSKSKIKAEALRQALTEVLELIDEKSNIELELTEVKSWVRPQPMKADEALRGAMERAGRSLRACPEAELAIGIENGVHRFSDMINEYWIDFAFVVALTPLMIKYVSTSCGIQFPTNIVFLSESKQAQDTCGQIMEKLKMVKDGKDPHSSLTFGALSRKESLIQPLKVVLIQALS